MKNITKKLTLAVLVGVLPLAPLTTHAMNNQNISTKQKTLYTSRILASRLGLSRIITLVDILLLFGLHFAGSQSSPFYSEMSRKCLIAQEYLDMLLNKIIMIKRIKKEAEVLENLTTQQKERIKKILKSLDHENTFHLKKKRVFL